MDTLHWFQQTKRRVKGNTNTNTTIMINTNTNTNITITINRVIITSNWYT
jgi:hypothetical protein